MLSANNILAPKDGRPVVSPTQDMVMGVYYLTIHVPGSKGEGKIFANMDEMQMAYQLGEVSLQAKVKVRLTKEINGVEKSKIMENTVGRFIFNESLPQDLGFVERKSEDDMFLLELDPKDKDGNMIPVDKSRLGKIVDKCYRKHGNTKTAIVLDEIKRLGFKYSTKGAVTISVSDMDIPPAKKEILSKADERVDKIEKMYRRGLISNDERYEQVIDTWKTATDDVTKALMDNLHRLNSVYMMANSGARGSVNQIK
jgi:DNA-directed RNA polymerase subunit beta'